MTELLRATAAVDAWQLNNAFCASFGMVPPQRRLARAVRACHDLPMATPRDPGSNTGSSMIPTLSYRDPEAAIAWLHRAFGFTQRLLVRDDAGAVRHAQLTWGAGMVMLSRAEGEPGPQGVCVVVSDVDAHHARALTAGATVELPPNDQGHGRMYSCRDPEGHRWHFGEYDPMGAAGRLTYA